MIKHCYFESIFQLLFKSRTFLILHRDSVFLLIYLMQCLWIYSIIIRQFTGKYFCNFSNLQRNITSTERLSILDDVLRPCWGVQHAFQRRSARLILARLKMVLYVDLSRAIWKSSGTPQHSTASKIGLEYFVFSWFVCYSMVFCNQFVFECFVPNIWLLLKTRT